MASSWTKYASAAAISHSTLVNHDIHSRLSQSITEGKRAYALEHASTESKRAEKWANAWSALSERCRLVLEQLLMDEEVDMKLVEIIVPDFQDPDSLDDEFDLDL